MHVQEAKAKHMLGETIEEVDLAFSMGPTTAEMPLSLFFTAWPGDVGHDYETIEKRGFVGLCVQR